MKLALIATVVADGFYALQPGIGAEARMDWPTRSIVSRIRWMAIGRRLRARRLTGAVFRRWRPRGVRESLYALDRQGDRLPLIVFVATDRSGAVIEMCACDAEDYDA
jgi:hypothetical protein